MPSFNFNPLPETLRLTASAASLPKHWDFKVSFLSGWLPPKRHMIAFFSNVINGGCGTGYLDIKSQDTPTEYGFNALLYSILSCAKVNDLWEKKLNCMAVACEVKPSGSVVLVAKSNLEALQMPVRPLPFNSPLLIVNSWISPHPPSISPLGQGRRIYHRQSPATVGNSDLNIGWFLNPDKRLEEVPAMRGVDRFTFWLALFAIAPKSCYGVTNGEALALRLGALVQPGIPASMKLSDFKPLIATIGCCMLWTPSRLVFLFPGAVPYLEGFIELDQTGLHRNSHFTWYASQKPDEIWSVRKLSNTLLLASYGTSGL
jgi:hypothetical protein